MTGIEIDTISTEIFTDQNEVQKYPKLTKALVVAAAVLTLSGCDIFDNNDNDENDSAPLPPITSSTTINPGPTDSTEVQPEVTINPCIGESFCYESSGDMMQAFKDTITYVQPYFEEIYQNPIVPNYYLIGNNESPLQTPCGSHDSENSAFYCNGNDTVYLGQEMMWRMYDTEDLGDAGLGYVLAHEYGHALQDQLGVPPPQTERETIVSENQADCIAGSWAKWADENGVLIADDKAEFERTINFIASPLGAERNHGTAEERFESFMLGYANGLYYCNDYDSQHPLITY